MRSEMDEQAKKMEELTVMMASCLEKLGGDATPSRTKKGAWF